MAMNHYEEFRSLATKKISLGTFSILSFSRPTEILSGHDALVEKLCHVTLNIANEAFGSKGERDLANMRGRLLNVDELVFLDDQGELVGFSTGHSYPDQGLFYLDGVVMLPKAGGGGKGTALIETISNGFGRLACTTQNPVIFRLMRKMMVSVSPSPEKPETSDALRDVAVRLVGKRGHLDPKTFVIRDLYPSCRYTEIPSSGDPQIDRWFRDALDVVSGQTRNGFFLIGQR
jgi:hypothetical protein